MVRFIALAVGLTLVLTSAEGSQGDDLHVRLRNVAASAGLRFIHHYSPTAGKYFVESAPGGLAVFDYNGDGRPDISSRTGPPTPSLEKSSAAFANRLYRNDGQMRFTMSPRPQV